LERELSFGELRFRLVVVRVQTGSDVDYVLVTWVDQRTDAGSGRQDSFDNIVLRVHVNEIQPADSLTHKTDLAAEQRVSAAGLFSRENERAILVSGREGIIQVIE
jgi:hypothetical protein